MNKNRRSAQSTGDKKRNLMVDSDVIPWVLLVIVGFLVMIFIIRYSGAAETVKQFVH